MSEAWWSVSNARTEGFYKGVESMGKALTKDEVTKCLQITVAEINGEEEGADSMNDKTENLTMLDKARNAWLKWATDNNITITNTQTETRELMEEAFVDGYLKGFAKRLTEGA